MDETGGFRFCRRCLLREMTEDIYYRNLQEYLAELEEERKAPEELYENRLRTCKECERLVNGLCQACGCYVEMRAAIRDNKCPYRKW